jgi:hypothetical protein
MTMTMRGVGAASAVDVVRWVGAALAARVAMTGTKCGVVVARVRLVA